MYLILRWFRKNVTHTYKYTQTHTYIQASGRDGKTNVVKYQQLRNLGEKYMGVLWAILATFL